MDKNPQREQMAHESMVRNLAAQAEAVWPQELPLLRRLPLSASFRALDVGCGTGECALRLAAAYPGAHVVGVDVHEPHLAHARERGAASGAGDRLEFHVGDAFALDFADDSFDLVLCRHMLQAVPSPERVLAEMKRVARPGGFLHLAAEDYAMLHFAPTTRDIEAFFLNGPCRFARDTGSDLLSGRRTPALLRALGLERVTIDYAILDTERVRRETLAEIFRAWKDGYAEVIAAHTELTLDETRSAFDEMIGACLDPNGYAVWQLPIVQGQLPD